MKFAPVAIAAAMVAAPAAADTVVHNSAPAGGWFFGSGNDYAPANSTVLTTTSGNELALRFHQTYIPAPASNNGVYNFALGTTPLSFDWSFTGAPTQGQLTLTNVGTGDTYSYNPFFFINDNAVSGNTSQNSFRFNWVNDGTWWIPAQPGFFTPSVDSTYRVDFNAGGDSLAITAVFGAGAAVPEPATWALLILGFGLVGAAMRRKPAATVSYA